MHGCRSASGGIRSFAQLASMTACREGQSAYPSGGIGSHGYFSVALAAALNWAFPASVSPTFPGHAAGAITAQDTNNDGPVSAALLHSMLVEKRPSDHPTHRRPMINFKFVKDITKSCELHSLLRSTGMCGKVVLPMEHETKEPMSLQELFELARSKNIRVIEAEGLGDKSGLRYQKRGVEHIVLNSSMTDNEKIRALGHLLEEDPNFVELDTAKIAEQLGLISLRCPKG
jgi:hypothetical protein